MMPSPFPHCLQLAKAPAGGAGLEEVVDDGKADEKAHSPTENVSISEEHQENDQPANDAQIDIYSPDTPPLFRGRIGDGINVYWDVCRRLNVCQARRGWWLHLATDVWQDMIYDWRGGWHGELHVDWRPDEVGTLWGINRSV
eukprot:62557_1